MKKATPSFTPPFLEKQPDIVYIRPICCGIKRINRVFSEKERFFLALLFRLLGKILSDLRT
jgi:hypothetical protein